MYKLDCNNTTYTIPLDSLDLTYMSRHFNNGSAKPMSLWRISNGEDYYKFKLNAWRMPESDDEEDDTDHLPSESLLCHTCNIYVPVMYVNEHNNSEKHINMKKIINLMMLRTRNCDLKYTSEPPEAKSCYYCEDCSLVISKKDSESHTQSYTHKKSLRNTCLIEQFLKFYSEDLNDNKKINTTPLQDYCNKFVNRKNLSFKINALNGNTLRIIVNRNDLKIHFNNFHGLVETETEMICILCEVQVGRVLKLIEQHIESKKHRKKVTRNIDGEHCIRELNDNFTHCIICNELVLLTRVAGHKILSYHTANLNMAQGKKNTGDFNKNHIFSNVTKENSFRKYLKDELIDNDNVVSEDISEEYELGYKHPTSNVIHTKNTLCSIDLNKSPASTSFNNNIFNQLQSNNYVEEKNIRSYIKLTNDLNNDADTDLPCASVARTQCSNEGDMKVDNIDLAVEEPLKYNAVKYLDMDPIEIPSNFVDKIQYLILETIIEKEIICKVCNVLMSNSDLNMFKHFNGEGHTVKYNELLKINRVTKAQNKFFCYSCKASITSKNELEHILGVKHRNKFLNDTDYEQVFCGFCKVNISESVQEHQNSDGHLQACIFNGVNVQEQIQEDGEFSDKPNIIANEISKVSDTETNIYIPLAKTENVFLKLHYHLAKTANPYKLLCKICNIFLTNTVVRIDAHIESFYHTNKYKSLLDSHIIEKDGNRFHCKTCDVFVTIKNEIEHIAGVKHKSKLTGASDTPKNDQQTLDGADIEISNDNINSISVKDVDPLVQTPESLIAEDEETIDDIEYHTDDDIDEISYEETTNITSIEKTEIDRANIATTHYHVVKTSNYYEVLCKVCDVVLSNSATNIETHIQGYSHSYRYKKILESNRIVIDGNRFHCKTCDVFVTNKNEIQHITGYKHKSRLTEAVDTINNDEQTLDDADIETSESQITKDEENIDDIEYHTDDDISEISYEETTNITSIEKTEIDRANIATTHYHVAKTSNYYEVLCRVCDVVLSNSVTNIETHIQGYSHSKKYEQLLKSNKIEKDNNRYRCNICNVFVSIKNELEHISGSKHRINAQNYTNPVASTLVDDYDEDIFDNLQIINRLTNILKMLKNNFENNC